MRKNENLLIEDGVIKRTCTSCGQVTTYTRKTKPHQCPFCNDIYWDKPTDERNLFILQDKYLKDQSNPDILGDMYLLILEYSRNIIINSIKDNIILSQESVDEKAEDLASTLLEKYLKDKTFKVEYSFGGFLIRLSKGILYNQKSKNNDRNSSFDQEIADRLTIESNPGYFTKDSDAKLKYEKLAFSQYEKMSDNMVVNELNQLINSIYSRILISESRKDSILFLLGLNQFLSKENISMTDYYDYCGNKPRILIEKTKMFIRRYLIDRKES